jgi:glycosyltransferase involved in cell wall biosynthesis
MQAVPASCHLPRPRVSRGRGTLLCYSWPMSPEDDARPSPGRARPAPGGRRSRQRASDRAGSAGTGDALVARIDLHCHSSFSSRSDQWLASNLGVGGATASPQTVYRRAKARGMTHVTLTDQDTIEGALSLEHLNGFIVGEEITSTFPGEDRQVHLLVWGLTREQHAAIQELRFSLYELSAYLRGEAIAHALAHPCSLSSGRFEARHLEALAELVPIWETRNGLSSQGENELAADVVATVNLRRGGESGGRRARLIAACAGSNDHTGMDVGITYTEIALRALDDPLPAALLRGGTEARGAHGSTAKLAHSGVLMLAQSHGESAGLGALARSPITWRLVRTNAGRHVAAAAVNLAARPPRRRSRTATRSAVLGQMSAFLSGDTPDDTPVSHERVLAMAQAAWRDAVSAQAAAAMSHGLSGLLGDRDLLTDMGRTQALLLAPYLMAAGFHARQERLAEDTRRALAGSPLELAPANGRPSVAMFTDTIEEVNGVATVLNTLQRYSEAQDWPFHMVAAGASRVSAGDRETFPTVARVDSDLYQGFPLAIVNALEVLVWAESRHVGLVHMATPGPVGLAGLLIALALDVPLVATYHTDFPRMALALTGDHLAEESAWAAMRLIYDQCDLVLCPSRSTLEDLGRHRVRSRLELFEQAIDRDAFGPALHDPEVRRELGGDKLILLWVGRMSPEKGLDALASVYNNIRADRDDIQLVLVGDGPFREEMERLVPAARFLGVRRDHELATIYASADLFLFPGRAETFGQVVLEAAASGLPSVVSMGTGVEEVIVPDRTALAVAPGDMAGFERAVRRLLDDEDLRRVMGALAREHATRRTWPVTFERLRQTYADFLDDDRWGLHGPAAGPSPAAPPSPPAAPLSSASGHDV